MAIVVRILVGLVAALFIFMAFGFWFALDQTIAGFAVTPDNILGRASIRADFGGFFFGVGLMSAMACWRRSRAYAFGAMLLLILALAGRIVSLVLDGVAPGGTEPMVVEALSIAILAWARHDWKAAVPA